MRHLLDPVTCSLASWSLLRAPAVGAPNAARRLPLPITPRIRRWLCLPGRADSCSAPLPTTALGPAGYGANSVGTPAKDPPLDCFYVYPTVSRDQGLNSDLSPSEEKAAAGVQFARFAGVCRTFAPLYRQMTLGAVAAYSAGTDISAAAALAYRDVAASWRNYLATRNNGPPIRADRPQPGQPDAADADQP